MTPAVTNAGMAMLHANPLLIFEFAFPVTWIFKVGDLGAQDYLYISTLLLPRCTVLSILLCICGLLFLYLQRWNNNPHCTEFWKSVKR